MVNRIIGSFFFIELLVALSIGIYWSINGIAPHPIKLSDDFLGFIKICSIELQSFKLEIPSIPSVPYFEVYNGWLLILNAFIGFINGITGLINFVILVVNYLIQLLEFIFIFIKNLVALVGNLQTQSA